MNVIKKITSIDVMNLVEGEVNEVFVTDHIKVVCVNDATLSVSFGLEQIVAIDNAYLLDCFDAAIIVNKKIAHLIGNSQPLVDCGEFYMTIEDYIASEWSMGSMNFENAYLTNNKVLYSRTDDVCNNKDLPIWEWRIGYKDRDYDTSVKIGDVRRTYVELFDRGNLIQDMVSKLFLDNCAQ